MSSGILGGKLYIGQDNIVFWGDPDVPDSGLYDNSLGSFINDATLTFQLYQSDGTTAVSNGSGSLSYITGSKGCYKGVLEDDAATTENTEYVLQITATASGDRIGKRRLRYFAEYQGAN